MKRITLAERQRAVDQLWAIADAATARTLARALAPLTARLHAHNAALTAAGLDDLDGLPEAWVVAAEAELLPALSTGWELGVLAASSQLAAQVANAAAGGILPAAQGAVAAQSARWLAAAQDRVFKLGDEVWRIARHQLEVGFSAGESIAELAGRLQEVTDLALPTARAVARTNIIAAANAGGLAQARSLGQFGPWGRRWLATNDGRTRPWHSEAHGQIVALDEPFIVGGEQLDHPGDGSPENSANCRCTEIFIEDKPEGEVGELEHITMTLDETTAAAGEVQTGAMVALVPSDADCARLAVEGFELPEEIHATLAFLGEADGWAAEPRQVVQDIAAALAQRPPIVASLHGLGVFNAIDNPCALYLVGDTELAYDPPLTPALGCLHESLWRELDDYGREGIPDQHSPWVPHLAIGYGLDLAALEHVGTDVTFDRIRVAWAGEMIDFPFAADGSAATNTPTPTIAPDEEADMTANLLLTFANIRNAGDGDDAIFDRAAVAAARFEQLIGNPVVWSRIGAALHDPARFLRGLGPLGMAFTTEATAQIKAHVAAGELLAAQRIVLQGMEYTAEQLGRASAAAVAAAGDPMDAPEEWTAVLCIEDEPTLEKPARVFAAGSLEWRTLPFPLMWMEVDSHGGMPVCPTYQVGLVTRVERDGNLIRAGGVWDDDPGNEEGVECRRRVDEGMLRWGSVDVGDVGEADVEYIWPEGAADPDEMSPEELDELTMDELFVEPEQVVFHHGRITKWTLVPDPAFEDAVITPNTAAAEPEPADDEAPAEPATLTEAQAAGQTSFVTTSNGTSNGTPAVVAQSDAAPTFAPVGVHHTDTADGEWDAATNEGRLVEPLTVEQVQATYAWYDESAADDAGTFPLSACRWLHHEVGEDGAPGPANVSACTSAIAELNSGSSVPDEDRQGVYDHLAAHLTDAGQDPPELLPLEEAAALVAAAYRIELPDLPSLSWYRKPPRDIVRRGALTITDEGRVYGLLAPGNVPHVGRLDRKTVPLRNVDYQRFLRGETPVVRDDGSIGRIVTGNLTMGCGHASTAASNGVTMDHFDNSCSLFATVVCGEADGDVWVAGALLHGVEPDQVRRAMACQLSGHWNPHELARGKYELLGALLVPVPGFPMARKAATRYQATDDGDLMMVASAVPVLFERTRPEPVRGSLGAVAERIARSVGRDHRSRAAAAAARVHR